MLTAFLLALRSISRNRVRAGLTVLGILIGVAALIAVATLGAGVAARVSGSMGNLASNSLAVGPREPSPGEGRKSHPHPLTEGDVRQIVNEIAAVEHAAPVLASPTQVINGDRNKGTTAFGTTTAFFALRSEPLARGAGWTTLEEKTKQRVCVLGSSIAHALFGSQNPIGRTVRINKFPWRVSGVLAEQGPSSSGDDFDNTVFMPIGSYRARIKETPQGRIDMVMLTASSTDRAQRDITALLRQRHRISPDGPPDFWISGASELEHVQLIIAGALSALLLCVASVSLVVGGIGVMNIMLVSVRERTREIGIRLSIGATSKDILTQFLVESVVLTSMGGLLGLAVGALGSVALGHLVGFTLSPNPLVAAIAVVSSGAIGVFFGYMPARRAATLDPIQALRTE